MLVLQIHYLTYSAKFIGTIPSQDTADMRKEAVHV